MSALTEARPLSFERTIDPHLVWMVAPESTYVTDWHFDSQEEVLRIANRLPLTHFKYSDSPHPYPDVVLLSQIAAQAGVIVVSEFLDVPLDSTFLLRRLAIDIDPLENNRLGRDATRYELTTDRERTHFKQRRTGRPPTGTMTAHTTLEGRPAGTLEIQGIWVTDEMFQMFRRAGGGFDATKVETHSAEELEPDPHTGRSLPRNRVISRLRPDGPEAYVGTLLVDEEDPMFFERPLDHVPGFLMLDAARQATTAAVCRERSVGPDRVVVDHADFVFSRFAEKDAPVECRVDISEGIRSVAMECTQGGRKVCEATLGATVLDG
jgi:2-oxo-3-(phosphooxy)propyl 3-oxoalkanoate synthase